MYFLLSWRWGRWFARWFARWLANTVLHVPTYTCSFTGSEVITLATDQRRFERHPTPRTLGSYTGTHVPTFRLDASNVDSGHAKIRSQHKQRKDPRNLELTPSRV
ncbi:hypothetical protein DFP73DRAFT_558128 [Morchella snyderi]|nr:hypothetical protein DFP73DRAFT_558128 [Morchella snyderi]